VARADTRAAQTGRRESQGFPALQVANLATAKMFFRKSSGVVSAQIRAASLLLSRF
jgi:hypothetical protein